MTKPKISKKIALYVTVGSVLSIISAKCHDLEPFGENKKNQNSEDCIKLREVNEYCYATCSGLFYIEEAECDMGWYYSPLDCFLKCPSMFEMDEEDCPVEWNSAVDCLVDHVGDWYCDDQGKASLDPYCTAELSALEECAVINTDDNEEPSVVGCDPEIGEHGLIRDVYDYCDAVCTGLNEIGNTDCDLGWYSSSLDCFLNCPWMFEMDEEDCQGDFDAYVNCLWDHVNEWFCDDQDKASLDPYCTTELSALEECAAEA